MGIHRAKIKASPMLIYLTNRCLENTARMAVYHEGGLGGKVEIYGSPVSVSYVDDCLYYYLPDVDEEPVIHTSFGFIWDLPIGTLVMFLSCSQDVMVTIDYDGEKYSIYDHLAYLTL